MTEKHPCLNQISELKHRIHEIVHGKPDYHDKNKKTNNIGIGTTIGQKESGIIGNTRNPKGFGWITKNKYP